MFGKHKIAIVSFLILTVTFVGVSYAQEIKDSDFDGLSDISESNMYRTNPSESDTDGDTYSDMQEVLNDSDPLSKNSTPINGLNSNEIGLLTREDPIAWYVSRISGIVAFILLTFVASFGLLQTSRALVKIRIMGVLTAQEVHRMLAWAAMLTVILHVSALMFDDYFKIRLSEVLIPFTLKRSFMSEAGYDLNIAVALGIVGLYTVVLLIVTSELRHKIVSVKIWRAIHYISFAGYIMFLVHGFITGSDSDEIWMKAIYISSLTLVLTLLLAKIFKKRLFLNPRAPKKVETTQTPPAEIKS